MEIGERIAELRKSKGITQEKLSAALHVSRQAVQKWETATALPDISNIIETAKYFDVTVDYLLRGEDKRTVEQQRIVNTILPSYSKMEFWEMYSSDLETEYQQCVDEGLDVEPMHELMTATSKLQPSPEKEKITDVIFNMVCNLKMAEGYAFDEPSTYDGIVQLRKPAGLSEKSMPNNAELKNKILGAWKGRAAGCLFGKPIEGIRSSDMETLLKGSGNWPLKRYILSTDLTDEIALKCAFTFPAKMFFADVVKCAPADDDTNYTVMAATKIIEQYSRDFTPENVIAAWVESQSKNAYCTAERVAFCNFVKGYMPPDSAKYKNPYREWIGAQIRADYYGYINPGDPETASNMAFRDASISHVKNGIYGEMYVAAMIARAAVSDDIHDIISAGLSVMPASSRLFAEVSEVVKRIDGGMTHDEFFTFIHSRYNENTTHGWCHTISNALIVTAALLHGDKDFGKSLCYAVSCCFDTDCNGATVGSVLGMCLGAAALPYEWMKPIGDTQTTMIIGHDHERFTELAELTMKHISQKTK